MAKCRICGHEWQPRTKEPQACPKCKRYDWKEPVKILSIILAFILILPAVQAVNITQTNYSVYIHGGNGSTGYVDLAAINLTDSQIRNLTLTGWTCSGNSCNFSVFADNDNYTALTQYFNITNFTSVKVYYNASDNTWRNISELGLIGQGNWSLERISSLRSRLNASLAGGDGYDYGIRDALAGGSYWLNESGQIPTSYQDTKLKISNDFITFVQDYMNTRPNWFGVKNSSGSNLFTGNIENGWLLDNQEFWNYYSYTDARYPTYFFDWKSNSWKIWMKGANNGTHGMPDWTDTRFKQEFKWRYAFTRTDYPYPSINITFLMTAHDPFIRTFVDTKNNNGIDSYTKSLLHMNGADASTTFIDEMGKSVTVSGNAQIDTAQSKFGGASGLFDGTGDYLSTPDSADWYFGTGDFTIDFWVRFNLLASGEYEVLSQYVDSSNRWFCGFWKDISGDPIFYFVVDSGGSRIINLATDGIAGLTTGTWYHFAVVRSGNSWYFFKDGVQLGSTATESDAVPDLVSPLYIGAHGPSLYFLNGSLDEFRISKGIARWTSTFTPPAREYGFLHNITIPISLGQEKTYFDVKQTDTGTWGVWSPISWQTWLYNQSGRYYKSTSTGAWSSDTYSLSNPALIAFDGVANDNVYMLTSNFRAGGSKHSDFQITGENVSAPSTKYGKISYFYKFNSTQNNNFLFSLGYAKTSTSTYTDNVACTNNPCTWQLGWSNETLEQVANSTLTYYDLSDGGLVGWWKFNEGSGSSVADSSGNGNNGTLNDTSRWTSSGKYGNAIDFDDHTYVDLGDLDLFYPLSIEAWFKADANSAEMIVGKGNSYYLWIDGTNQVRFEFNDGSGWKNVYGSAIITGQWYHVVATYDGTISKIYVNGSLVNSASYNTNPQNTGEPARIGSSTIHTGREFDGIIDNAKIYRRALTADEIKADYLATADDYPNWQKVDKGSNVVQHSVPLSFKYDGGAAGVWHFDEGAGSTATDSSGNGNNGNLTVAWLYRKPITVSNSGSALTDYQVNVTTDISSLMTAKVQADCDDIRFTDSDGTTLLNHWTELCDNSSYSYYDGLRSGLVGEWKLNESSGNAADTSGNGNTGTVYGATWTTGKYGNALSFDGNDYVSVADSNSLDFGANDFTIAFWVKPNALGSDHEFISKFYNTGTWGDGIILEHAAGGVGLRFVTRPNTADTIGTQVSYANSISVGYWSHVVALRTGSTLKLYINGLEKASTTGSADNVNTNVNMEIGRLGSIGRYFNGTIDEVRIYNRSLSADEIKALYEENSKFWVKVPSVPSGSKTIYMYYGNPTATSASNGTNTFDFFDDFESGNLNKWTTIAGTWTVTTVSGNNVATDTSGSGRIGIRSSSYQVADAIIEYKLYAPSTDADYNPGVLSRFASFSTNNFYNFAWRCHSTQNRWCLDKYGVDIACYAGDSPEANWKNVKYVFTGTSHKAYINGVLRIDTTDSGKITSDYVGINAYNTGGAYWDNYRVRKYASTEPTTSVGTEEALSPDWVDGKYGKALSFDGIGDYVLVSNSPSINISGNQITVETWIKPSIVGQIDKWLVKKMAGGDGGYRLGVNNAKIAFQIPNSTAWSYALAGTTSLLANTWYHVIGTYDGSTMRIYVNGALESSMSKTENVIPVPDNLWIGTWSSSVGFFNGTIDEVRIYPRALTETEIRKHYQSEVSKYYDDFGTAAGGKFYRYVGVEDSSTNLQPITPKDTVLHLRFNDNSTVNVTDYSGYGNGVTVNGSTWVTNSSCINNFGGCMMFDGNDNLKVVNSTILPPKDITFGLWMKILSTGVYQYIIDTNDDTTGMTFQVRDNLAGYYITLGNVAFNNYTAYSFDSNWHQVIFTYNGSTTTTYVDGVQKSSFTVSGSPNINWDSNPITIGRRTTHAFWFNGSLDEFIIINRSLAADEIKQLYLGGYNRTIGSNTHRVASYDGLNSIAFNLTDHDSITQQDYDQRLLLISGDLPKITITPSATVLKRGDFLNISINESSDVQGSVIASLVFPNNTVKQLSLYNPSFNFWTTNYTFASADPLGGYTINATDDLFTNGTNATLSSIKITLESGRMNAIRQIIGRPNTNINVYGSVLSADGSPVSSQSLSFAYDNSLIGTNSSDGLGNYSFTFQIPYEGIYNFTATGDSVQNSSALRIFSKPQDVKYKLAYRLGSSKTDDVYRIGNFNGTIDDINLTVTQYASNLTHAYACSYNGAGDLLLSLIHSYKKFDLNFVNFSTDTTELNYTLELSQKISSSLLLAYTKGTCDNVDNKMYLVEQQIIPSNPFSSFSFPVPKEYPLEIRVQYDKIELNGSDRFGLGSHKVCIDKSGISLANKPVVDVEKC